MNLVDKLIKDGWLKTPEIIDAFRKIKREDFLTGEIKDLSEVNEALPIGHSQTISQPLVVAFMLELLSPEKGDKILDIGYGSGWTTALLAEIVGKEGKVIGIEIIPELVEFGKKNIEKYNFIEKGIVKCISDDGTKGYPEMEKGFDKILSSASADKLPDAWKQQLKIGGRIVSPINTSIWLFVKRTQYRFDEIEHAGFVFVPLIKKE